MNKQVTFVLILFLFPILLLGQSDINYDDFFIDKTMRIDYYHTGDAKIEIITIDKIYEQGMWAGSQKNLIDLFNNGCYYIKILDVESGKLIYSRGFNSYFGEYKTSDPAQNGIQRTYHESALIPYPKKKIKFVIERRDKQNILHPYFSQEINPQDVMIIRDPVDKDVKSFKIIKNGNPHHKVDLAFIAEGYTAAEEMKFKSDLEKFAKYFFSQEPYKSNKENFNLYGVFKPSDESGCDGPRQGSFRNTVLSATFNSLGLERYLLTEDNKSLRDIAAHVPYDALLIMVNHNRYGGGGIYNLYCAFTAHNQWSEFVLLHEFGHSFGGLGDEYYTSSVVYNDFYPRGIEPTEPNITALLDPENLKWKELITPGIEIPTSWEKKDYDSMDEEYQKKRKELNDLIDRLNMERVSEEKIKQAEEELAELSQENALDMNNYLKKSKFYGMVGAFEGCGYSSKGLYRPMLNCIMFSKGKKPYCQVCNSAISEVIRYFSE